MLISEYLLQLLFGQRCNNNSRVVVLQHRVKPFKITVSSFDMFMKLCNLNFKGDEISAQKSSLIFLVADNAQGYLCKCKFVNLLYTLLSFDIELTLTKIYRKPFHLRLRHLHIIRMTFFSIVFFIFLNKSVYRTFDSFKRKLL